MSTDATVTLTQEQVGIVLNALIDKKIESERYRGPEKFRDMEATDTCCDWHRMRYERDRDVHAALAARVAAEKEVIALFDAVEER